MTRCGTHFLLALLVASPAPVAAVKYAEEVISFSTHDGLELGGIVSYPTRGAGPFPAMLLIHGSGVHDADLTLDIPAWNLTRGEQRLFRDLARFLRGRGMTVLRYNKRGGSFEHENDQPALLFNAALGDLVRDAEAAYRALASHPMTDPGRIAIYGHSEGSMVAPRVARRVDRPKLVVLVGSVSTRFEEAIHFRSVEIFHLFFELAADADGDGQVTLEELDRLDGDFGRGSFWVGSLEQALFLLAPQGDNATTVRSFQPGVDTNRDGQLDVTEELLPLLEELHRGNMFAWRNGTASGRLGQTVIGARAARDFIWKVRTPILFVQGELDFQTPLRETLDLIEVLESKGWTDHEALLFPQLGHSLSKPNDFFFGDGGLTILDNPTLNAMRRPTMRKISKKVLSLLAE